MSLEHLLYLSFCGVFFFLLPLSKKFISVPCCHCQYFGTFWLCEGLAVWFALQEWHTQAQLSVLGTALWKCRHVTAASSWWPEQTAHCTPLNKRTVFYYHQASHLECCPAFCSTEIIPVAWSER